MSQQADEIARLLEQHVLTMEQRKRLAWVRPLAVAMLSLLGGAFGSGFAMAMYLGRLARVEAVTAIQADIRTMQLDLATQRETINGVRRDLEIYRELVVQPLGTIVKGKP
ncbi:MAG TPA: hypothetical protein VFU97_24440 [Xanthobacteraceae bacterium]|nr:hypothetical protein [Xanthobacteraceae bacterium]